MTEEQKPTDEEPKRQKKLRKPRAVKMSQKQKNLVRALVGPAKGNVSEAGRLAGYGTAQAAHRAMQKIETKFNAYLEKHGMDDDYLAEKCLKPALEAMETKFFANKGIVLDHRDVVAWSPRLTALDMVFKIKGAYKQTDDADKSESQAHTVCLVVTDERRAARLASLLAPGGAAGVVIDVDAKVDQNVG